MRRAFIFIGIACLLIAGLAFGANTGRLAGRVLDSEGAPLPGVTVQITSANLIGGPQVAISGADGEFAFNLLQVGDYTVEANLAGFRPAAGELRVSADAVASVTFRMIPEQFGGEIEVSAEVPVVDTSQVNSRQVWDQDYLQYATIGTANRSYQSVLSQAAGVTGGHGYLDAEGPFGRVVGRRQPETGQILLDGQGAGYRSAAVIFVVPTGDGVAAEADHTTAIVVHFGDQCAVDGIELASQFLGAALRPELAHQFLGKSRETGNIGEEHRSPDAIRQRVTSGQRQPTIDWYVSV